MNLAKFLSAGFGTVAAQAISLACLPFLSRLYSPTDFAPWALGLAFVSLIGSVATLRYDLAIVVERDHLKASALFWLTLMLAFLVGLCASAAIFFTTQKHWLFRGTQVEFSAYLVAVWLLFFVLNQALLGWAMHRGAFLDISFSQIANAIVANLVQFAGAGFSGGAYWLILGSILGQLTALVVLFRGVIQREYAPAPMAACIDRFWSLMVFYRRFPFYSLPFTLFSSVRDRAAILLLGTWVSAREIGLYSQAWRLINVPAGICGSAIRPVLFHGAAQNGLNEYESHIGRILTVLVLAGAPLLAIIEYRPAELFAYILGEKWRGAGPLVAAMAPPAFIFALSNWMDRMLDVAGRQEVNLLTEFISALTSIAGLVIALVSGASFLIAVQIQCAILTLNYACFIYLAYRIAGYRTRILLRLAALCILLVIVSTLLLRMAGV